MTKPRENCASGEDTSASVKGTVRRESEHVEGRYTADVPQRLYLSTEGWWYGTEAGWPLTRRTGVFTDATGEAGNTTGGWR